jgi:hypothetical protein
MRTGNKLMTGIVGGIALLTMMIGGAEADVCCSSGTVLDAGTPHPIVSSSHSATLICDSGMLSNTPDWDGNEARVFEIVGSTKDIKLVVAMAAIVGNKKVNYCLANAKTPTVAPSGNVNGHLTAIHVTETPVN